MVSLFAYYAAKPFELLPATCDAEKITARFMFARLNHQFISPTLPVDTMPLRSLRWLGL
jgi:hypothetical protein